MIQSRTCPECNAEIPTDAPPGVCPSCALRAGLGRDSATRRVMRLCHITPHLPPDQAANALLPFHLGEQARAVGDHVAYVSHVPRRAGTAALPGPVVWIPRRQAGRGPSTTLSSVMQALRIVQAVLPVIRACEVVHLHSNGLLCELGAWLARRLRKPTVLTLYGTDIWHYRPRRGIDLFTSSYRQADHVTFYSRGLMRHAEGLGLRGRPRRSSTRRSPRAFTGTAEMSERPSATRSVSVNTGCS